MQSLAQARWEYDVFISYSRKDIVFARLFEEALKTARDQSSPAPALKIFRDEEKLGGNEYYRSIDRCLRQSRKLLLIASPNSYRSQFVNDEVRDFIRMKGAENVFVVLLAGLPNHEAVGDKEAQKAFPELLHQVMRLPLAADYREFTPSLDRIEGGRYRQEWRKTLEYLFQENSSAWDIFMSYAPGDEWFARQLDAALKKYHPPEGLGLPTRRLAVFRDEDDASKSSRQKIHEALQESRKMALICSARTSASDDTREMVRQFAALKGAENIIPIVIPHDDASPPDQQVFPEELLSWIARPSYIDYSQFQNKNARVDRGLFEGTWYSLISSYYDADRGHLEQREKKRQIRNRNLRLGTALGLIALLSGFLIWALISQRAAIQARNEALASRNSEAIQRKKAEAATVEAEKQRDAAIAAQAAEAIAKRGEEIQRRQAELSADDARQQRDLAETRRKEAEAQKEIAIDRERKTRQLLYASNLNLAQREFGNLDLRRGHEILESSLPMPLSGDALSKEAIQAEPELRGFNWYQIWRTYHNEQRTVRTSQSPVTAVAFSPDESTVALGHRDGSVTMHNATTGALLQAFPALLFPVWALAFSPDQRQLAIGGWDGTTDPASKQNGTGVVKLWDLGLGKEISPSLRGVQDIVKRLAFSRNGQILVATTDTQRVVEIWDLQKKQRLRLLRGYASAVSSDGRFLAIADDSAPNAPPDTPRGFHILLWDLILQREVTTWKGGRGVVQNLIFSKNVDQLIGSIWADNSDAYSSIAVWRIAPGSSELTQVETKLQGVKVDGLDFSANHHLLGLELDDFSGRVWDISEEKILRTLKGHKSAILASAFSPSGATLITGDDAGLIKLWDVRHQEGHAMVEVSGTRSTTAPIAFSLDGRLFGTSGFDGDVRIWNAEDKKSLAWLRVNPQTATAMSFSRNNTMVAIGMNNGQVALFDLQTQKNLSQWDAGPGELSLAAFTPAGDELITLGSHGAARRWSVPSRSLLASFNLKLAPKESITAAALSQTSDGPILTICRKNPEANRIQAWRWGAEAPLFESEPLTQVAALAVAPNGKLVAASETNRAVTLWNLETRRRWQAPRLQARFQDRFQDEYANSLAFSPDSQFLAAGSSGGAAKVWEAESSREIATLAEAKGIPLCLAFSPDGKTLATNEQNGAVTLWDTRTWRKSFGDTLNTYDGTSRAAFSPDGTKAAIWFFNRLSIGGPTPYDHEIEIWDAKTQKKLKEVRVGPSFPTAVAFTPRGDALAVLGAGVELYDIETGSKRVVSSSGPYSDLAYLRDGTLVAVSSSNGSVKVRDVETGKELAAISNRLRIDRAAFLQHGEWLGLKFDSSPFTGANGPTQLWHWPSGKLITLQNSAPLINSFSLSADETRLATAEQNYDGESQIALWNTANGTERARFSIGKGQATLAAIAPDGQTLIAGRDDGVVKFWDLRSGQELGLFKEHESNVSLALFSPSGNLLITGDTNKRIKIWLTATEEAVRAQRDP